MKVVVIFLLSSFLLAAVAANGQTFFKDSTVWYVQTDMVHATIIYKEVLRIDSVTNNSEYYSVTKLPFYKFRVSPDRPDTMVYQLIVKDSVMYFRGFVYVEWDSAVFFESAKLFDYKMKLTDTVSISFPDWVTCSYLLDSISANKDLKRYYFSKPVPASAGCGYFITNKSFTQSNIGFNGLMPFDINWARNNRVYTISACHKGTLLYADTNLYFFQSGSSIYDLCEEDSLKFWLENNIPDHIIEAIKINVKIYPNPATEKLHIKLTEPKGDYQVQIFDATGKKLTNRSIGPGEEVVDISALPKGIFIVLVTDEKGNFYSQKVIKM